MSFFPQKLPEQHLFEEMVCCLDSDLSVPIEPEEFELAGDHVGDLVAVSGCAGTAAYHVRGQRVNLLAVFVWK